MKTPLYNRFGYQFMAHQLRNKMRIAALRFRSCDRVARSFFLRKAIEARDQALECEEAERRTEEVYKGKLL